MKTITFRCIKCDTEIQAPEKTKSVLCGVCCTWNHPSGGLTNIRDLMKSSSSYERYSHSANKESSHENKNFPAAIPEVLTEERDEEEIQINPISTAVSRIFTIIIIVFSVFTVLSDYVDTPYTMPIAAGIIALLSVLIIKKALDQKKAMSDDSHHRQ